MAPFVVAFMKSFSMILYHKNLDVFYILSIKQNEYVLVIIKNKKMCIQNAVISFVCLRYFINVYLVLQKLGNALSSILCFRRLLESHYCVIRFI